jgi:hypothetical protein
MIRHELLDLPNNKYGLAINCGDVIGDFCLPNQRFYIEQLFRNLFKKYNVKPQSEIKDPLGGENLLDIRLVSKYNIGDKARGEDVFVVEIIPPIEPD